MFRRSRLVVLFLVIVVLAGVWLQGCTAGGQTGKNSGGSSPQAENKPAADPGAKAAPDFNLKGLDSREYRLADFRGKKVLINFWTTWCPYCLEEMPLLQKFHEQNKDGGWQVLTVDITSSEKSLADVQNYIKSKGFTFPVLLDEKGEVASRYGVRSIPASYILNEQGQIIKTKVGPFSEKEIGELGRLK